MKYPYRYLEMYDKHGLAILGNDGTVFFDQRKKNSTVIKEVSERIKKQYGLAIKDNKYVMPRSKYCKVIRQKYQSYNPSAQEVLQETTMLHDLF